MYVFTYLNYTKRISYLILTCMQFKFKYRNNWIGIKKYPLLNKSDASWKNMGKT